MIKKIFKIYKDYQEIINYLIFGGLTFLLSIGIYYGLTYKLLDPNNGIQLQIANIISWICAVIFAYITNKKYVFESKSNNIIKEFTNFTGARIVTLLLEMIIMYLFVTILGLNDKIMKIIAQIIVIISNYIFSKLFVFKNKHKYKNIIFDIGGVIFDFENNNLDNKFNTPKEEAKRIEDIAFGSSFNDCLLGNLDLKKYAKMIIKNNKEIEKELKYILEPKYYHETYPLVKEVYDLVKELNKQGYNIYILSNINEDSYKYVCNVIDKKYYKGFVASYQEHLIKPDPKIYDLIMKRYNLKKEETIFFDDSSKNIETANEYGIKGIKYTSIKDILNNLE